MNEHTLQVLSFDSLLDSICEQAQSGAGIKIIKSLLPYNDLDRIQRRRALYADMIAIRNKPLDIPPLRVEELDEVLRQAAPEGAVLDGTELVSCLGNLEIAAGVRKFVDDRECEPYAELRRIAAPVDSCPELRSSLSRSLDRDGTVLDSASDTLRNLRRQAISLEQRIQRHLDQMVKSSEWDSSLQEHFVTVRSGRYVVPVKRDARNAMPGIVHDLSNSGQTLFVEPTETLGWGNDLARTRLEERDEVIRILAALTAQLRNKLGAIYENQRIIAELDAAAAIARWAGWNNCDLPVFTRDLKLETARHPLLQIQFRKENAGREVVPLNLDLPRGTKTLAITGSNTGGKTVALKTVGLICLAAQSGLPVPVGPGSTFQIFDHILADIGDEQSIQSNLSTFSAHIKNVKDILGEVRGGRSLVLLDELGVGTDPVEGGAIACGILGALAKHNALTITTTHLAMVKNFVHSRQNMVNAAVRFDVKTLKPEYILDIGRPGASHAILIAKRLGLPEAVISDAQKMMSEDQLKLEDMLTRMEADQRRIANHATKLADTESDLTAKRDALKAELEDLRKQRRQMLLNAHQQAEALVSNTRREMENLIREIRETAKNAAEKQEKPDTEAIRQALAEKERRVKAGLKIHAPKVKKPVGQESLHAGLRVWVEKLQSHGVVESVFAGGGKVSLSINGVSFTMGVKELEEARDGHNEEEVKQEMKFVRPRAEGAVHSELNVIGMRVEEALSVIAGFIDRSVMAGMPEVRIVHGFGTGRLRSGIHTWLRECSSVKSFYLGRDGKEPGGGGCTIVKFSE